MVQAGGAEMATEKSLAVHHDQPGQDASYVYESSAFS